MYVKQFCRRRLTVGLVLVSTALVGGQASISAHETGMDLTEDEANTVRIVEDYGPSVVAIHVRVGDVEMDPGEQEAGGSGFIIDDESRIATNFHVVAAALEEGSVDMQPEASVTVSFLDQDDQEHPVRVQGANPDYDLALLEFEDAEDLPSVDPIPLGDSTEVRTGQNVIAIGTPFGLHSTVTTGIVSAIEREQPGLVGIELPFIQTDAAINPGNSGGPLLSSSAEVIGINNAILASPTAPGGIEGVGFAVPVDLLKENMEELVSGGLTGIAAAVADIPERPRIGVSAPLTVDNYPPPVRQELEMPDHGVVVMDVTPGGPADEAGLEGPSDTVMYEGQPLPTGGDIITGLDGKEVERLIDLQQVVLEKDAGDVVALDVWRDGDERSVDVALEIVPLEE